MFSFRAVHAAVPWHGVLLAYGAAQVVGSFPVVPGGFGIVEGSLAVILTAYGAGQVPALATAITFRVVNFWLAIVVGWLAVAVIAIQARRAGPARAGRGARPAGRQPRLTQAPADSGSFCSTSSPSMVIWISSLTTQRPSSSMLKVSPKSRRSILVWAL